MKTGGLPDVQIASKTKVVNSSYSVSFSSNSFSSSKHVSNLAIIVLNFSSFH